VLTFKIINGQATESSQMTARDWAMALEACARASFIPSPVFLEVLYNFFEHNASPVAIRDQVGVVVSLASLEQWEASVSLLRSIFSEVSILSCIDNASLFNCLTLLVATGFFRSS